MCVCYSCPAHETRVSSHLASAVGDLLTTSAEFAESNDECAPVVAGTARLEIAPTSLPTNFTREDLTVAILVNLLLLLYYSRPRVE